MANEKAMVVKDNLLIEASYRLELSEQRLILMAIVKARATKPITSDTVLEVTAKDYSEICDMDIRNAYRRMKEAAETLFERKVRLRSTHERTGKNAITTTRWVSSCTYVEQAGIVELQLAPKIIPYITDLESKFTSYQLKNVAQMTSTYAIRLYELLAQYKTIGARYLQIQQLKEFLGADEKSYERLDNFKRIVLKVAVEQINTLTDLDVSFIDKKSGRSVVGFEFIIQQKRVEKTIDVADKKQKEPQSASTTKVAIGLSLSEKSMLRDLAAKTGRSEPEVLAEAQKQGGDLFVELDKMLKA